MARTPRLWFAGTDRCGLCALLLPWTNPSGLEAWQHPFRAVLYLKSDDEDDRINESEWEDIDNEDGGDDKADEGSDDGDDGKDATQFPKLCAFDNVGPIKLTSLAVFSAKEYQNEVTLVGDWQNRAIIIIHSRKRALEMGINQIAFCFHDWCYSVLKWKVPYCTESEIYKLARSISRSPRKWELGHRDRDILGFINNPALNWLANNSSPFLFPSSMARLPTELRVDIWEYIGLNTASNAFTRVADGTSTLVSSLKCAKTRKIFLKRGAHLSLRMISVFGTDYIQDLENEPCSTIIPGVVARLEFAMSLGGICAIKLLGSDWDTGWLGKIPRGGCVWYGTIQQPGPSISCSYNDLYCTKISSNTLNRKDQVLWDQSDIPQSLYNPAALLFDYHRYHIHEELPIKEEGYLQFFTYLSLYENDDHASGLTLYMSGHGVNGLEAHFSGVSRLSGNRKGCPRYFAFDPKERIAYAWLQFPNYESRAPVFPSLIIQTTLGRNYSFGRYVSTEDVMNDMYEWILLYTRGYIAGLYYETPDIPIITRFGVAGDGLVLSEMPQSVAPLYLECIAPELSTEGPGTRLFLSVANFSDMKRVEVCRVGNHCSGMLIHYYTALPVVLGQWHTHHSKHDCIFQSSGPGIDSPSTFYFKTSWSGDHDIITDVSFSPYMSEDGPYHVLSFEMSIAWWYSEVDDVIWHWDGAYFPVPEEYLVEQLRVLISQDFET